MGALAGIFGAVGPILDTLLKGLLPDPNQRLQLINQILQTLSQSDQLQDEVNKIEAQGDSLFKAGWRPAFGWIGVVAMAYQYLLVPIGMYVSYSLGYPIPKPPVLDDTLWQLVFGLLGLGAMRSYEKTQGIK